ncbi:MAG: VCBS repeat-containing protein, partial [Planctomycetaceae bacterium]
IDGDGDMEISIGYWNNPSLIFDNTSGPFKSTSVGPEGDVHDTRSVAWGDYDDDGDLDLALGNSNLGRNMVYENTPSGFVLDWTAPLVENTRSVAWGDFNGDGDLDLAVGNFQQNRIYINNDGDLDLWPGFSEGLGTIGDTYAVAWGDYDGDQDLDLAAGNYDSKPNYIYINRGGIFTQTVNLGLGSDKTTALAWGDFDQDYDLDLLVGNQNGTNRIFVNSGSGSFSSLSLPAPADSCSLDTRSVDWTDWDGDGDLDVVTGNAGVSGCVQVIVSHNTGSSWEFETVWQTTVLPGSPDYDVRSVAWGDYDGDGDPDLAVGVPVGVGINNFVLRNDAGGFTKVWSATASDSGGTRSVAWGDMDGDGDLDLAVGNSNSPAEPSRVYVNDWNGSTNTANDPTYAVIYRPDYVEMANFFSSHSVVGYSSLPILYDLYDDEFDSAFQVVPQISWDGGGNWESAWGAGWIYDVPASPSGVLNYFEWDAMGQLLNHQGIPFNPALSVYVPFEQSYEEMDVVFRLVVWSNPEHGGLIQRPVYGSNTTQWRHDVRPEWDDSKMVVNPTVVHPGETIEYTI